MTTLSLYYKSTCPYCIKVMDFMKQKNIVVNMLDTNLTHNRDELIRKGGQGQVPCLKIDDQYGESMMYESDRIISYLATI